MKTSPRRWRPSTDHWVIGRIADLGIHNEDMEWLRDQLDHIFEHCRSPSNIGNKSFDRLVEALLELKHTES